LAINTDSKMRTIGLYLKYLFNRFIFIIALCLGVFLFFFLKQKELLIFNYSVNNPLYPFIEQTPTWLYVVQVLIIIFLLLVIVELISLISVTMRKSSAEKKNQLLAKQIWEEIFVQKRPHFSKADRNYPIYRLLIVER